MTDATAAESIAPNVLVIVPTYNERANIESLIEQVMSAGPEFSMLIVDDSSPDGTGALADSRCRGEVRAASLCSIAAQSRESVERTSLASSGRFCGISLIS